MSQPASTRTNKYMQSQDNLTHPKYRKDIDGLRAIAVNVNKNVAIFKKSYY
jgi:hypothetical protein